MLSGPKGETKNTCILPMYRQAQVIDDRKNFFDRRICGIIFFMYLGRQVGDNRKSFEREFCLKYFLKQNTFGKIPKKIFALNKAF